MTVVMVDIGTEGEPYVIEPIQSPIETTPAIPAPAPEREPVPIEAPELVPA